ncbi:MAG: Rne/Rng family ribonuclease [Flaviflexus sp.]|nr:Rne/Rng family ribonuclease [Flaviflexus sp.]
MADQADETGVAPIFSNPFSDEPENADAAQAPVIPAAFLLFQEPDPTHVVRPAVSSDDDEDDEDNEERKPRRRGSRGRGRSEDRHEDERDERDERDEHDERADDEEDSSESDEDEEATGTTRRRRRRRSRSDDSSARDGRDDEEEQGSRRRRRRRNDEVESVKGSTRLEAKRQRRRESRESGRRKQTITESEFLARREAVDRLMLVREQNGLNQIAVLEDDILVEHYVARHTQTSMVGNVYLGRVQNVLPSMEAAFVDIGKGRNAVLYAGEVNWEAAGLEGKPRRIEQALKSGDSVLVQVTKDPIGHKGARLTAQITLAGRHLVLVPSGAMTGISRKLPDKERQRLKKLLKEIVPAKHGVIVRTAAEGATEDQLRGDVERLTKRWAEIEAAQKKAKSAPVLLKAEPELAVRVVRDVFNEDFQKLYIEGKKTYNTIRDYVHELSPELDDRVHQWVEKKDIFTDHRVDEQLAKAMDRKVFLPSGGSLVIDRTEAMTVIDVNTGKFTGSGGSLEETVTKNNLEAAEEIVRQLRLRDIGGIIVIDFIDMVLESNRDLVLRRLIECLGRDRTRHQVAEVTSLGLVQMTRKRVGQGLVEAFSTTCEACDGRGFLTHAHPVEKGESSGQAKKKDRKAAEADKPKNKPKAKQAPATDPDDQAKREEVKAALASIAAAAQRQSGEEQDDSASDKDGKAGKPSGKGAKGAKDSTDSKDSQDSSGSTDSKASKSPANRGKSASATEAGEGSKKTSEKPARKAKKSKDKDEDKATSAKSTKKSGDSDDREPAQKKPAKKSATGSRGESKASGVVRAKKASTDREEKAKPATAKDPKTQDAKSKDAKAADKPAKRARRVASSGTIVPKTTSGTGIMTFPAPKSAK